MKKETNMTGRMTRQSHFLSDVIKEANQNKRQQKLRYANADQINQSTFSYLQTGTYQNPNGSGPKSHLDNLEKTKEILILSERTFTQSARSLIQHVEKKGRQ